MLWIFRKIVDRIQALLIAESALGLEAEFLGRQTDRKAHLLHKAQEYEEQGLEDLAEELRGQVRELSVEKPLGSVVPVLSQLKGDSTETDQPMLGGLPEARNDLSTNNGVKTKKASRRKARS